jgi:hypothetical protein
MKGSLKTRSIALNGVLGALAVVCLLLADFLPTNTISLYALSSFFVSIAIVENGVRAGWIFYIATGLLSLIIVPDKMILIPYVLFFGMYGIVKFYIEKLRRIVIEYILKFIYFNACAAVIYAAAASLLAGLPVMKLSWWILIAAAEAVFFIYDIVYTMFINYYRTKIRAKLRLG